MGETGLLTPCKRGQGGPPQNDHVFPGHGGSVGAALESQLLCLARTPWGIYQPLRLGFLQQQHLARWIVMKIK